MLRINIICILVIFTKLKGLNSENVLKYIYAVPENGYKLFVHGNLTSKQTKQLNATEPWTSIQYTRNGRPLITEGNVDLFKGKTCLEFVPRRQIIKESLGSEGNLLLLLPSALINSAIFHFYNDHYPADWNYQINFTDFSIKKCTNGSPESCTDSSEIHCLQSVSSSPGELPIFKEKSNDIVYISWKNDSSAFNILMQMTNKIVECVDPAPLKFKQIILVSNTSAQFSFLGSEFGFNFSTSTTPSSNVFNTHFNLDYDQYIYFQIALCNHCTADVKLICAENLFNMSISGFSTGESLRGDWHEVLLGGEYAKDCNIQIITRIESNQPQEDPWWITQDEIHLVQATKADLKTEKFNSKILHGITNCYDRIGNAYNQIGKVYDQNTALCLSDDQNKLETCYGPNPGLSREFRIEFTRPAQLKESDGAYVIFQIYDTSITDNEIWPYQLKLTLQNVNDKEETTVKRKTVNFKKPPYIEPFFDLTINATYKLTVVSEIHEASSTIFVV